MTHTIDRLGPDDVPLLHALMVVFGEAFDERDVYGNDGPDDDYVRRLLGDDTIIVLVARDGRAVLGGAVAYELRKFERKRSELYLYDLAVEASHRRRGIARALIERLRGIAAERGAHALYVQADTGPEDAPAIALYRSLGVEERVLHFDIDMTGR